MQKYPQYEFHIRKCQYIPFKGLILQEVNVRRDNHPLLKARQIVINNFQSQRLEVKLVSVHLESDFFHLFPGGKTRHFSRSMRIFIHRGYIGDDFQILKGLFLIDSQGTNFFLQGDYRLGDFTLQGYFAREVFLILDSPTLGIKAEGIYSPHKEKFNAQLVARGKVYPLSFLLKTSPEIIIQDVSLDGFKIQGPFKLKDINNLDSDWKFRSGKLDLKGKMEIKNSPENLEMYVTLDKANIAGVELLTNLYITYLKSRRILEFKTVGSVVNRRPFPEFSGEFKFLPQGIAINDFCYQGGLKLTGLWKYGKELSFNGKFEKFSLSELLYIFFPQYQRVLSLSGIGGRILYFSFDNSKFAELYWEIPQGKIGDIEFTDGKLHLVGKSEVMEFVNSQLMIGSTPYMLEGRIDFSKFPDSEMWKDVYLVSVAPAVSWGKLGLERHFEEKRISLGAKLSDIVRLDYNVEFSDQGEYNRNEVTLEIKGTPSFKLRLRGDEEIMGIEKKIKF